MIGKHAGLSMPEAETIQNWKTKYLAVWDKYIDGLVPKPGFKEERRAVILKSFNRLIALCKSQEG